jgi:hypothetical protein
VYPYVFRYDAAGRQTKSGYDRTTEGSTTCNTQVTGLGQSTYDAENHIQSSSIYQASGTATWGPDGRQRISQSGSVTKTAHWDGGTLLFTTGGNNTPQLYIGKSGTMDYAGDIDVYDRDQTGAEVSSHGYVTTGGNRPWWMTNGNWVDGWSTGSVRTIQVQKSGKTYYLQFFIGTCNAYFTVGNDTEYYACPAVAATFEMKRADGYKMVGGIVQGARTFDSTSGQWLSPDPYAGDMNDPMSQNPSRGTTIIQMNMRILVDMMPRRRVLTEAEPKTTTLSRSLQTIIRVIRKLGTGSPIMSFKYSNS